MASSAASASAFPFTPGVRQKLASWFAQYGSNSVYEVECRIRGVTEPGFERVLQSLTSCHAWTNTPTPEVSVDQIHATGVRESRKLVTGQAPPATFMRKQHGDEFFADAAGHDIKFQVSSERESSADASPVHCWRHKQRIEFIHKDVFRYDLTRVKQGSNDQAARAAETQFEIELEFCGQTTDAASRPEYLADSMLLKVWGPDPHPRPRPNTNSYSRPRPHPHSNPQVADLLRLLEGAGAGGSNPLKRQRTGTGSSSLVECEELLLAPGTEVTLYPSGQGAPPPFGGELPAELAARIPWVFSHMEPDGQAAILSLPSAIGDNRYPIYYFSGAVPVASLIRRPGM